MCVPHTPCRRRSRRARRPRRGARRRSRDRRPRHRRSARSGESTYPRVVEGDSRARNTTRRPLIAAVTITANGGLGSTYTVGTATITSRPGAAPPAISTNALINRAGQAGGPGIAISATAGSSGHGASSFLGAGGAGRTTAGTGTAATGYGAGAGGAGRPRSRPSPVAAVTGTPRACR